ncbi:hypothetical protein J1D01_03040 [Seonamhaeicola sp. NFXS20]
MLFNKNDKRERDYYDNLGYRYKEKFLGVLLFGAVYGVYKIIEWVFL